MGQVFGRRVFNQEFTDRLLTLPTNSGLGEQSFPIALWSLSFDQTQYYLFIFIVK